MSSAKVCALYDAFVQPTSSPVAQINRGYHLVDSIQETNAGPDSQIVEI